jgi:hypothetical protein
VGPAEPRRRHQLEELLNADATDIMSAVMGGFRAIIDVKGKLAEYFLGKQFAALKKQGVIDSYVWNDRDGQPDFQVRFQGVDLLIEAKNVRTPGERKRPVTGERPYRVELQKTRNSKDGTNTRGYRVEEFDCLAVCLFNETGKWDYLYTTVPELVRRETDTGFLKIMQEVPRTASGIWKGDLVDVLRRAAQEKRRS